MKANLKVDARTSKGTLFKKLVEGEGIELKQGILNSLKCCTFCNDNPLKDETVKCNKCKSVFHGKCVLTSLSTEVILAISANPCMWWFCLDCLQVNDDDEEETSDNVETTNNQVNIAQLINDMKNDIVSEMQNTVNGIIEKKLGNGIPKESSQSVQEERSAPKTQHSILVTTRDSQVGDENFTTKSWANVLNGSISEKLKDIPVSKSIVTKEGKGCITFPTENERDMAKEVLEEEFNVELSDRQRKLLFPKLKICDVNNDLYKRKDTEKLKKAILSKNKDISEMVLNQNLQFQIIYIEEHPTGEGHAVVKVDPKIRNKIISMNRRIYIDLSSCYVKDQFHLIQCFKCQKFGHKKDHHYAVRVTNLYASIVLISMIQKTVK